MDYPKQVMKMSELKGMGFPEEYLMDAYRDQKQTFAWKMDMTKKNSPIVFDTSGLEEYRLKQIKLEREAMKHRQIVY